ncbi:GEVED domain-containing protein [Salegentibacter chungangensis]|uniref:GEVED domain-containing protein n=1 Tax=Salegentibacter chungangensis TaxID=1335724 RepID=A0ABW3NMB3_9FLAO
MRKFYALLFFLFLFQTNAIAQKGEVSAPLYIETSKPVQGSAFSESELIPAGEEYEIYNPRERGISKVVPGKGLPRGGDPVMQRTMGNVPSRAPLFSFNVAETKATPTDPTGVAGPNHYVNAYNSAFSIYDKEGNQLLPPVSLSSIGGEFENESDGDPIVVYDGFADRYVISQLSTSPNSVLIAVSKGPDPVNDGWYTYRFTTPGLGIRRVPDYPKISVWGDGYYITSNKDALSPEDNEVIFVVEREKMLIGEPARVLSFPLPGIKNNGFYSPAGFNARGNENPPLGNAPIVYLQDDAWEGVSEDHLKIWEVNVDWNNPANSSVSESQELGAAEGVSAFRSVFDGGGHRNLAQPEEAGDIDALQAIMMYSTSFRRFETHNSVVMNFVVDVEPTAAKHAAIRWYELRQPPNGGDWSVYQEGTYAPDGSDRFCGSINIDAEGNIGLGYAVVNDSPSNPVFPSLRFTGRYFYDEPGIMTIEEQSIVEGQSPNPDFKYGRYGDYSHLSVDAADGLTFWFNGEYFEGDQRINKVGVFKIQPELDNDLGIVALLEPENATLGSSEEISVSVRNFGELPQSGFEVSYTVDGGEMVTEVFEETIQPGSSVKFTFSETADLSEIGTEYELVVSTELNGDGNMDNDAFTAIVKNLPPVDGGVTSIDAPSSMRLLGGSEAITVTIENLGGMPLQDIPLSYDIGYGPEVREVFEGEIPVGDYAVYTFSETADLSKTGKYTIRARTNLEGDARPSNDETLKNLVNINCIPEGSDCSLGDGLFYFELNGVENDNIRCETGYGDFTGSGIELDRAEEDFSVTVESAWANGDDEQFSMWIDFNDNAVFEDNELLIDSEVITEASTRLSYDFSLPQGAALGQHLLRIRAGDTSFAGDLNDPCNVMGYGTTHDYTVNITDSTLNLEDFILNDAKLYVLNRVNNQIRIVLETTFDEPLQITVFDILGQKMLQNFMEKEEEAYVYNLDMSYAAKGVYLLRVGTGKVGKVQRFIVK